MHFSMYTHIDCSIIKADRLKMWAATPNRMAGSDEEVKCKRSMDCKCPECLAASAAFSIDDLKAFSSTISYG